MSNKVSLPTLPNPVWQHSEELGHIDGPRAFTLDQLNIPLSFRHGAKFYMDHTQGGCTVTASIFFFQYFI